MRLSLNGNRQHLFGYRHFQIHTRIQRLAQNAHVAIGNMATVFTQVHGNAVCARLLNDKRRLNRVRVCGAACIT